MYPQALIIVMAFPGNLEHTDVGILTPPQVASYLQYMMAMREHIAQQGLNNVFYFSVDGTGMPVTDWCGSHPSAAAHQFMAQQLYAFIASAYPAWSSA